MSRNKSKPVSLSNGLFSKKNILWGLLGGFVAANVVVYKHAYHFTHISKGERSSSPESLSIGQKAKLLLGGISLPKSENIYNNTLPQRQTIWIPSRKEKIKLETWLDEVPNSKGIIAMFHGYGGCKSSYENEANFFRELGYSTLMVDFPAHGGSEGEEISLGYHEAEDIKSVTNWIQENKTEQPIILYAASMGAAAVLRASAIYKLEVEKLILECPFATMKQTVKGRFAAMGVPSTGFAEWLMFWGGIQHNFWAFTHNPRRYAKKVSTPVLLMGGKDDERVQNWEIVHIYDNLKGDKKLQWINAGHESYILADEAIWKEATKEFLGK